MANEYAVNQNDLTAVANAIRTKGGTTAGLSFPDGFVNAIAGMSSELKQARGTYKAPYFGASSVLTINPGFKVKTAILVLTELYGNSYGLYWDGVGTYQTAENGNGTIRVSASMTVSSNASTTTFTLGKYGSATLTWANSLAWFVFG